MITLRRTKGRRYTLVLAAEHASSGPYYLLDISGHGVAWTAPALEGPEEQTCWAKTFERARLAFELADLYEDVNAREAKAAADKTFEHLGRGGEGLEAVTYAYQLVEKWRGRAKR